MMHARPVPLTIYVHPAMADGLAKAARQHGNLGVAAYGEMLLSAAYAVRIGQEKGQPEDDRELDAMVRLALACAGAADIGQIAGFLGLEDSLVRKVLDGWCMVSTQRRPAREPEKPQAEPVRREGVLVKAGPAKAAPKTGPKAEMANPLTDAQTLLFLYLASRAGADGADISQSAMVKEGGHAAKALPFDLTRIQQAGLMAASAGKPDGTGGRIVFYRLTAKGAALQRELGE